MMIKVHNRDRTVDGPVLGRVDLIAIRAVIVLVVLIGVAAGLGPRLLVWATTGTVFWEGKENRSTPPEPLYEIGSDTAVRTLDISWSRENASLVDLLVSISTGLLAVVALVVGAAAVWSLISRARAGDPFGGRSVAALRTIGVALLIYGLVHPVLTSLTAQYLAPAPEHMVASFEITTGWTLPVGLLVMVLAQIWRRGRELRTETAGLV